MASVVDICNMALDSVGQASIMSAFPPDNSAQARACNRRYESVRDAVLRAHLWNCATTRVQLTKLANDPAWGFTNQFQIPADFIRYISLDALDVPFRIEGGADGRVLLSDDADVNLRYIFRLTNVPQMDDLLIECIAARLASEIAYKLTSDKRLARDMYAAYLDKLNEARYADSLEAPIETMENREWVDARFGTDQRFRQIDVTGAPQ